MSRRIRGYALFVACSAATPAWSTQATTPVASVLLREGNPMAGGTITSITTTAPNHAGGFAIGANTDTGVSLFWGSPTFGPGSLIRTEGTFGSLVQTSFESFFGYSDAGLVGYSASGTGGPVGSFDSVWVDDTPIAVQGNPSTIPGLFWTFGSRPGITADGKIFWAGGTATTAGGTTSNRHLFFSAAGTRLYGGGDVIPGFGTVTTTTISFDYRFSKFGTNWIIDGQVTGSTATDTGIVLNGSLLMAGGGPVREGSPVPASIGGLPGENWANWASLGVNEAGDYLVTGDTSAATTVDSFIMKNGQIILREGGMTTDGGVISGNVSMAYMNENGDWAAIWTVNGLESLLLNGQRLLSVGDTVDFDGDGILDPGAKITDFTGIASLSLGDRRPGDLVDIYFVGLVDTLNTPSTADDFSSAMRMTFLIPSPATIALVGAGLFMLRRRRG